MSFEPLTSGLEIRGSVFRNAHRANPSGFFMYRRARESACPRPVTTPTRALRVRALRPAPSIAPRCSRASIRNVEGDAGVVSR